MHRDMPDPNTHCVADAYSVAVANHNTNAFDVTNPNRNANPYCIAYVHRNMPNAHPHLHRRAEHLRRDQRPVHRI